MQVSTLKLFLLAAGFLNLTGASGNDIAGMVKTLKGTAQIERSDKIIPASVGSEIQAKDRIRTDAESSIGITLQDNTLLSAGSSAILDLNEYHFNTTTHDGKLDASLKRGSLAVISGKMAKANPKAVRFNMGTVTLGVRGTEFIIETGDSQED